MPVASRPEVSSPFINNFSPRVIFWIADGVWAHKVLRRRDKLRFISRLLKLADLVFPQECNMRPSEAAVFRDWLNVRGFPVEFTFATAGKSLGGSICYQQKIL